MIIMTERERELAADSGRREFGDDFFMVDPVGFAAPFRMQTDLDFEVFTQAASPRIRWEPSNFPGPRQKVIQ